MWNAFKMLVLYLVIQTVLIFGISAIYIGSGNNPDLLGNYMNDIQIILVIILALIFIPLLIEEYKKIDIKPSKTNNIYLYILFTIFLSVGYNIFAYYLDKYVLFSNLYGNNSNIIVGIISTVLVGPIIEELMFRGVMYNNLKKKFDFKKAMIITTIVFCLSHFTLIQIIYTFIFGLILVKIFYIQVVFQMMQSPTVQLQLIQSISILFYLEYVEDYIK